MSHRLSSRCWLIFVAALFLGCDKSLQSYQFKSAQKSAASGHFNEALSLFAKVMKTSPEDTQALDSARLGSKIAILDVRDYQLALDFLRHILLYSKDPQERIAAQKSLVDIQFDKLQNYDQALIELNLLIPRLSKVDRKAYQLKVAQAYQNLNNPSQALIEVDDILRGNLSDQLRFQSQLFKANLLQGTKEIDKAIVIFQDLLKKYPERSQEENVGMNLALCYEEKRELKAAISVLEEVKKSHSNPEFVQVRINRLKDRVLNLPGAKGWQR